MNPLLPYPPGSPVSYFAGAMLGALTSLAFNSMVKKLIPVSFALLFLVPALASAQTAGFTASPSSGPAPLAVVFSGNGSLGCMSGFYTLLYGDGWSDIIVIPPDGCSGTFTRNHTYIAGGTYTATLTSAGAVVGTQAVAVTGGSNVNVKLIDNFIFSYRATTSVAAPLEVTYGVGFVGDAMCDGASYSIDYGDGSSATISSSLYSALCNQPNFNEIRYVQGAFASHTYAASTTAAAKLKRNGQVIQSLSVSVGTIPTLAVSASVTSGAAPLSTSITAGAACPASGTSLASLSFGDNAGSIQSVPCNNGETLQHTYTFPGTYTITKTDTNGMSETVTVIVRPPVGDGEDEPDEDDVDTPSCPTLTKTLQRGDSDATTGGEVSKLQQFLTDYFQLDGSLVVGVFGPLTESYVKQFQIENNISPVGWVGPQTRAAIAHMCDEPLTLYTFLATPNQGPAPLLVDFSYADPNQNMVYNINFGDGASASLVYNVGTDCTIPSNCAPRYDAFHSYTQNGTYKASLTQVVDPCAGQTGCTTPLQVIELATTTVNVLSQTNASCVTLTYNLYAGATDATTNGEVTKLQNFLIAGGYMQGSATGFFGPITEQAVQKYQAGKGIVSSGSPDTTGYGFVGPQTRAAMAAGCSGGGDDLVGGTGALAVYPKSGAAPLTVQFSSNIGGTVDYGDGTRGEMGVGPSAGVWATSHTYASPTIYTASLLKQGGTACTPITYDPNNPLSFLDLVTGNTCAKTGLNVSGSTVVATVAVNVAQGLNTPAIKADPSTVPSGGTAKILWVSTPESAASTCTYDSPTNSPSDIAYGTVSAVGSAEVGPLTQDAMYTITCGGQSAVATVFIQRDKPTITAYPLSTPSGGRATITWSAPAGSTCIYSSPTNSPSGFPYGAWGNTGGTGVGPLTQDATYTITCGGQSSSVTVDVTGTSSAAPFAQIASALSALTSLVQQLQQMLNR